MNNDLVTSTLQQDTITHLVLDETGAIVDRCVGQTAAMKLQQFRERSTLKPHHVIPNRI